jgi:hypothetical protein
MFYFYLYLKVKSLFSSLVSQAGLQSEISPIKVKYSDKGDYKCSISGNSGSVSIGSESGAKTVTITGAINISSGIF